MFFISLSTASRPAMRPTQLVIQWVIPPNRIVKTMIDFRVKLTGNPPTCLHSLVPYQAQGDIIFTFCHLRNAFSCTGCVCVCVCVCMCVYVCVYTYRVSQEERTKLQESVPHVKLYRYNPKHLYPKLNGYGDNGQRKVWTSCISA